MLVKLDSIERGDVTVVRHAAGGQRDVVLRLDVGWALEAEKMVEESDVWAVTRAFDVGKLRLARVFEGFDDPFGPRSVVCVGHVLTR